MFNQNEWRILRLAMSRGISKGVQQVSMELQELPRPKPLPFFGTKLSLIAAGGASRLHEYIDVRHKQLGSIFCENMNGADVVFMNDPEIMRELFIKLEGKYPAHILPEAWVVYNQMYGTKRGLFFMDGEEWLHHRKILNRHLLREGTEKWLEKPIIEVTEKLINKWKTESKSESFVPDLEPEFYRLSINVIVAILAGSRTYATTNEYDYLLGLFSEAVRKIFITTTKLYVLPASFYAKHNFKVWQDFKESVDISLSLARKLVKEILSMKREANNGLIHKLIQEDLKEEDIIRIVADFVIAAGDTTSYTLLWTLYLLSLNKEVVAELRDKDGKFVNCVIKESMRLFPVAPFLTRIIPKECLLGPYVIKEWTPVVASIYTSGRSEANFSRPGEFLPHRWDRNDPRKAEMPQHVPSASLPFALGSRSCIGKKIALLQLTEVLRGLVENFDLTPLNMKPMRAVTSMVLVPRDPIKIQFTLKH